MIKNQIVSRLIRELNSNKDYRSVLPDICEWLLSETGLAALLIFSSKELDDYDILRLEFAQTEQGQVIEPFTLPFGKGFSGKVALSNKRIYPGKITELNDTDFNFLSSLPAAGWPFYEENKISSVFTVVFKVKPEPDDLAMMDNIAAAFSLYSKPLLLRKDLHRISRKFTLLNSFKKVFSGTLELRPVLSVFMNITASTLAAEVGVFVLFKEDSFQPDLEINWGLSISDLINFESAEGQSFFDYLLDSQEAISFKDFRASGFQVKEGDGFRGVLKSVLGTALRTQHGPIGVLVFANKTHTPGRLENSFDEQDQDLFSIMQDKLRVSIENYLLYKKIISIKNFNDNILQSIRSGIVSVDLSGRILMTNRRFREIFHLNDEIIGRHLSQVIDLPIFAIDQFEQHLRNGALQPNTEVTWEYQGEKLILGVVLSPLTDEMYRMIGAAVTITELTEQRALEAKIQRTEHLAALGELSAGLAHEIKNPLTAMKGFAQLLPKRLNDPAFMEKFSRAILNELMRLDDLTERLLAFAKPNVGGLQSINITEVVQDTLMLVKFQLEKNSIVWHLEAPDILPRVMGDTTRLTQVFLNIILNAIHAMPDGGELRIVFRLLAHWKGSGQSSSALQIDFSDTGCGISGENLTKLFNPFYTTKESGTGLGLSISYRIIEEHKGGIEVFSNKSEGSTFRIILPTIENQKDERSGE